MGTSTREKDSCLGAGVDADDGRGAQHVERRWRDWQFH